MSNQRSLLLNSASPYKTYLHLGVSFLRLPRFFLPPSLHPPVSFYFLSTHPPQEAGVQLGDTLEQLDGVHLGSFQDAIEKLKQRRGTVVITLLRQKDY